MAIAAGLFFSSEKRVGAHVRIPEHEHYAWSLIVPTHGSFRQASRRETIACMPGTLLTESPGDAHENEYGADGASMLVVRISNDLTVDLEARSDAPGQKVVAIADLLLRALNPEELDVIREALCFELLAMSRYGPGWKPRVRSKSLSDAVSAIWSEPSHARTVRQLAGTVGISPIRLARSFRQEYGISLGSYIREARLVQACLLIEKTTAPLADIAFEVGFSDQSHLTRSISSRFSTTPKRLRKPKC
ncbi:MAG TPA: helix-turn-helix transcriptional regulator [Candidatus Tumulicola sp.]